LIAKKVHALYNIIEEVHMNFKKLAVFMASAVFTITGLISLIQAENMDKTGTYVLDPYEKVDWEKFEHIHSFSHQHANRPPSYNPGAEVFWDMGFRHLPFSNYYPSSPTPLSDEFRKKHPDALWAPNAEQHSASGAGHFNAIDSYYSTGHGHSAKTGYSNKNKVSPVEYEFSGLNAYDPEKPWLSIYILYLYIGAEDNATLSITVEGAREINRGTHEPNEENILKNRKISAKLGAIYLRAESEKVKVRFDFKPEEIKRLAFGIRQGVHRPWKDAYRAALDGTLKDADGNPIEGLRFPDGGGITLNHTGSFSDTLEKLDFDPRVLGIEVWNQHFAFGPKGSLAFYNLWDEVLSTGKRCFGFFVRDHFIYERGRNVLILPPSKGLSIEEREHNAARAYRNGIFYGLLGALALDENGQKIAPYDCSEFRFTRITLKKDKDGNPESVEVAVDGADKTKRPNIQVRFITERGISLIENKPQASFKLSKDTDGKINEKYVRIEAFAYPSTHLKGKPLTAEAMAKMNVLEISRLHDILGGGYHGTVDFDKGKQAPVPIVDMLFSQPIIFNY